MNILKIGACVAALSSPVHAEVSAERSRATAQQLWKLGLGYFAAGNTDLAEIQWQACAQFDASNENCRQGLEGLDRLSASGGIKSAEAPSTAPLKIEPPATKSLFRSKHRAAARPAESAEPEERPIGAGAKAAPVRAASAEESQVFQTLRSPQSAQSRAVLEALSQPSSAPAKSADAVTGKNFSDPAAAAILAAADTRMRAQAEERRREAMRRAESGLANFQRGDVEHAREDWALCKMLDSQNADCQTGLQRLAGAADGSRQAAAAPAAEPVAAAPEENHRQAVRHWNTGILYFQRGDYAKAKEEWTACGQADPGNLDCQTGIQRIAASGSAR